MNLELFPEYTVYIELFTNLRNASALKENYRRFNCSIVNSSLVYSTQHILCAINRALYNRSNNRMKTLTIYTEIVYCLSASESIQKTLSTFGIQDDSTSVIAITLSQEDLNTMHSAIEGDIAPLEFINQLRNEELIIKEFGIKSEELTSEGNLNYSIFSRISIKDYK